MEEEIHRVYFRDTELGELDVAELRFRPVRALPQSAENARPAQNMFEATASCRTEGRLGSGLVTTTAFIVTDLVCNPSIRCS